MDNKEIVAFCQRMCLGANLVYLVRSGSHAYGTSTPESDSDYRGIFMPGEWGLLGTHHCHHLDEKEPDIVLKSLEHFVILASRSNPNVLEQLFVDGENLILCHELFENVLRSRGLFLSQLARKTYTGYALGQLEKMCKGNTRDLGAQRKELIARIGYDSKALSHVFRLIYQGRRLLETGELRVRLEGEELEHVVAIRRGEVFKTLEEAHYVAKGEIKKIDSVESPLPDEPNRAIVEDLLVSAHRRYLKRLWME